MLRPAGPLGRAVADMIDTGGFRAKHPTCIALKWRAAEYHLEALHTSTRKSHRELLEEFKDSSNPDWMAREYLQRSIYKRLRTPISAYSCNSSYLKTRVSRWYGMGPQELLAKMSNVLICGRSNPLSVGTRSFVSW